MIDVLNLAAWPLPPLPIPPAALWSFVLFLGLGILVKASDSFTGAAARAGRAFRLPEFLIGVTILAFGTSLPELVSSVLAVLRGATEIVAGNVVGSNIANLLMILGLAAVLAGRLEIQHRLMQVDLPYLVGSAFFLALILWDGEVGRVEGGFCLVGLALYMHYALMGKRLGRDGDPQPIAWWAALRTLLVLLLSALFIYVGADFTVQAVIHLAESADIGREVIAASAVAFGTSLPEVAVTISAARTGRSEMAVGNVVGSNVFNAFGVTGVSALVGTLVVPPSLLVYAVPVMLAATVLTVFIIMEKEMTHWEGWLMILLYVYFLAALFGLA